MLMLEKIISVIAPHICVGCSAEENVLLCESCQESLVRQPSRCYRCNAATEDYEVCRACRRHTALRTVVVYTKHEGPAKELLHHAKYERARSGLLEMATMMTPLLRIFEDDEIVLVHIPTASSRVRARGYDHAQIICRELARQSELPVATLLARFGQAHQVGSNRSQRMKQLNDAYRPIHVNKIQGKHIVLVDDVLTTGATLEIAARELRRAGAKRVSAAVFAQA
ncbi:ComF family protein [Candidatus Saccharibacteria bacterium]|nr:MAG: ComF family protein [Candidatus Saccharibacteria bacterium]